MPPAEQIQFDDMDSTPAKVRFSHSRRAGDVQFVALGEVPLADDQKLQHVFRLGPGTQVCALCPMPCAFPIDSPLDPRWEPGGFPAKHQVTATHELLLKLFISLCFNISSTH